MPTHDAVIVGSHVVLPTPPHSAPRQESPHRPDVLDVNIVIDDGVISDITREKPPADVVIDGEGLVSIPGAIDPHVHYGVYSPIDRAARTESHAAAVGGITTMMRMLRLPGAFEESLPEQLGAMSQGHYVDYSLHASVFTGRQVRGMEFCTRLGVCSFKIYMNLAGEVGHVYMDMPPGSGQLVSFEADVREDLIRDVIKEAARLGCPVLVHAEDYEMCGCGIKTARADGLDGLSAWSQSRPPKSEARAIRDVAAIGREHGCTIYFVHIGSAEALEQIRTERRLGGDIRVETCPHYLHLAHEEQRGYLAKVMPPIRTSADRAATWQAVSGRTVDTVGTDHVANRLDLKLGGSDVWGALAGFPGIGVMLPVLLHVGVNSGRIGLGDLARITSSNTARIFGMRGKGRIATGCDADITMIDLGLERRVSSDMFGGFSDYSPYEGAVLRGWPVKTVVRGSVVSDAFEVVGKPGHGRMAPRGADPDCASRAQDAGDC